MKNERSILRYDNTESMIEIFFMFLEWQLFIYFSFDAELHLVHYKSTYDNISAAVADNQPDSLAVVGILIKEASHWDQFDHVRDSESVENLKKAALQLSRPYRGPQSPSEELEVVVGQLMCDIT